MAVVDTILNGDPWSHIEVDVGVLLRKRGSNRIRPFIMTLAAELFIVRHVEFRASAAMDREDTCPRVQHNDHLG